MITCVFLPEEKRAKIKNYFQNTKYLCFSPLFFLLQRKKIRFLLKILQKDLEF